MTFNGVSIYYNLLKIIYYNTILYFFYSKFIFFLLLQRRPRNYYFLLLDYLAQPMINFSFGQLFAYFTWRRRVEIAWAFAIYTFILNIKILKNVQLSFGISGRRWRLYRWLRRFLLAYTTQSQSVFHIKWVFTAIQNQHGFWRLKKKGSRKRRLLKMTFKGDIT